MRYLYIFISVIFFSLQGLSDTLNVPGNYATIQGALTAAEDNDTIEVEPGTYMENLHFMGKGLTLRSTQGADFTFIDGDQTGSVIILSFAAVDSVVEGFTITNGLAAKGGGLFIEGGHPLIKDCIITNNATLDGLDAGSTPATPGGDGGGIYCTSADIINCVISLNRTGNGGDGTDYYSKPGKSGGNGGGVYCCWANIIGCTLDGNTTGEGGRAITSTVIPPGDGGCGGGLWCSDPNILISGCIISNNTTGEGGDALYEGGRGGAGAGVFAHDSLQIVNTLILNNMVGKSGTSFNQTNAVGTPGASGGGIHCQSGIIEKCRFIGNKAGLGGHNGFAFDTSGTGGHGGAVYTTDAELVNCLLAGNKAGQGGWGSPLSSAPGEGGQAGGVYWMSEGKMVNCTLVQNEAGQRGAYPGSTGPLSPGGGVLIPGGSIENCIFWENQPDQLIEEDSSVHHSDIQGGWLGDGNIAEDPLFEDPVAQDYHLTWVSPCINRGSNADAPPDDLEATARPFMGTVEMGAYEFTDLHPLEIDTFTLSASQGGDIDFNLYAGAAFAGRTYAVLGSATGTAPGIILPYGKVMPLEWDGVTDLIIEYWNNTFFLDFLGTLDAAGMKTPVLHIPNMQPIWVGATLYFSYTLYNPFNFVGNPIAIEIVM
ncbi:MAG: choice-of-anchor Q domain-containing protein [Planctomycetota bacterium]